MFSRPLMGDSDNADFCSIAKQVAASVTQLSASQNGSDIEEGLELTQPGPLLILETDKSPRQRLGRK